MLKLSILSNLIIFINFCYKKCRKSGLLENQQKKKIHILRSLSFKTISLKNNNKFTTNLRTNKSLKIKASFPNNSQIISLIIHHKSTQIKANKVIMKVSQSVKE